MALQQIQQQIGIARIILGSRGVKCFPQVGGHGRRHRENMQLRVLAEQEHQGSARLFHRYRDRPTSKALTDLRDPSLNGLRHMVHFAALTRTGVGLLQTPDVLFVRPINGQERGILDFGLVLTHEFSRLPPGITNVLLALLLYRRRTLLFEILIAESWHLSGLTVSEYSSQQSASRG